jgi:hypothetical protein
MISQSCRKTPDGTVVTQPMHPPSPRQQYSTVLISGQLRKNSNLQFGQIFKYLLGEHYNFIDDPQKK